MASQRMGVMASPRKTAGHDRCPDRIEIKQDHGADDFGVEEREGIEKLGERHAEANGEKPEAAGALLSQPRKKDAAGE